MLADLLEAKAYDHDPAGVDMVQTHISWVFLAGDLVYKLKKPVDFGFLDFTTLDKRAFFCREEVRLNRRLAPDIYLGVAEIVRDAEGHYAVREPGSGGEVVDYAIKMKRLPGEGMMKDRLDRGEVDEKTMDGIAALLADFYRRAETGGGINRFGQPEVIRFNTDENFSQTGDYVGLALDRRRFEAIRDYTGAFLNDRRELLARRIDGGYIRDCHGDLHMGNICLGEKIWVFDCIEFNERFRFSDIASDLAFLAMDLDYHGRPELGRRLIDRYIELSGDRELPEVLDFYKCYRAYVRGKISCFSFDQAGVPLKEREHALDAARRYFALAYGYAGGKKRPRMYVFFGLMASGKTSWAR
jgi:aminoglycoside phosphotransferase family enzyme